jgi:hypothetical protein
MRDPPPHLPIVSSIQHDAPILHLIRVHLIAAPSLHRGGGGVGRTGMVGSVEALVRESEGLQGGRLEDVSEEGWHAWERRVVRREEEGGREEGGRPERVSECSHIR